MYLKTITCNRYRITWICLILIILALMSVAHATNTTKISCYPDYDQDGYAEADAACFLCDIEVEKGEQWRFCADNYFMARFTEDLDDRDSSIHPYRAEIAFNDIDDDCDGKSDEAQPNYKKEGLDNTTDSFKAGFLLKDSNAMTLIENNQLVARVSYRKLEEHIGPWNTFDVTVEDNPPLQYVAVEIDGLEGTKVYETKIHFGQSDQKTDQISFIGDESDIYYTMTRSIDARANKRADVVLAGLKEYRDSESGKVGYLGSVDLDGTRYGADEGEFWCSEFYAWVAQVARPTIADPDIPSNIDTLIDYFTQCGTYFEPGNWSPYFAQPGDWIWLYNKELTGPQHSIMFLAYDRTDDKIWYLEGNGTHSHVHVKSLSGSYNRLGGLGKLFPCVDTDSDLACDAYDNCPGVANPDQHDYDGDGQGDACDPPPDLEAEIMDVTITDLESTSCYKITLTATIRNINSIEQTYETFNVTWTGPDDTNLGYLFKGLYPQIHTESVAFTRSQSITLQNSWLIDKTRLYEVSGIVGVSENGEVEVDPSHMLCGILVFTIEANTDNDIYELNWYNNSDSTMFGTTRPLVLPDRLHDFLMARFNEIRLKIEVKQKIEDMLGIDLMKELNDLSMHPYSSFIELDDSQWINVEELIVKSGIDQIYYSTQDDVVYVFVNPEQNITQAMTFQEIIPCVSPVI